MKISCLVPARNEQGRLSQLISDIVSIKEISEVIIIEGSSVDETYNEALQIASIYSDKVKVIKQPGVGKFDAVKWGAKFVSEDFLIIWDADGTVPLDSTIAVLNHAIATNHATVGNRLAGKIEPGAIQFFNYIGNWFFALVWSPILMNRPVDLLCGTKVLPTRIFLKFPRFIENVDPYGDFTILATLKANDFKIDFVPVNYEQRQYGKTNIRRWSGGVQLLTTTFLVYWWFLWRRIKNE
jgi:dolichol-phosphate mannosyltransferase